VFHFYYKIYTCTTCLAHKLRFGDKTHGIYNSFVLGGGWIMVFKTTFNNISVISWRSVLLLEETLVPGTNHGSAESH
jgi:hypothetical protein